jgi:hypothetical protein
MKYEVQTSTDLFGKEHTIIIATDENGEVLLIPADPANSDYQRYLNPEAEQSTPMIPGDE